MRSIRSRAVIFAVQHHHLFQGRLRPDVITEQTDLPRLRARFEAGAQKMGTIPDDVRVEPVAINGMYAEWIRPTQPAGPKVILYTHGGGYVSGNCADHRMHVAKLVAASRIPALLFDYRLAPEHPAPAAVDDTLAAYRWLLECGVQPSDVVVVGESAGGGLCIASLVAIRDEGLPTPRAGVAASPWLDLTCAGASYRDNARRDISLRGSWEVWSRFYAGNLGTRHPWVSPVYADLTGFPPVFIQVGTHEILLDDARVFAARAQQAGVRVTLRVWDGMVHCFAFFAPMFPEATAGMQELVDYITAC